MRTASTARGTRIPLAVIFVLVIGLVAGLAALAVTDNIPGRESSTSLVRQAPAVVIKGEPPAGQGEGLAGPGGALAPTVGGYTELGPGDGGVGSGVDSQTDAILPVDKMSPED